MSSKDNTTRKNRYARSSTISVTQLLTDSCSSLLQRLTTKVRGPSQTATADQHRPTHTATVEHHHQPSSTTPLAARVDTSFLGSTRSRLEDKYSSVLERLAGKRRDAERTLEPSASKTVEKRANPLAKSATTAVVSEKNYHSSVTQREKTPYRTSAHRLSQHNSTYYPEPAYAYLDHYSAYNVRQKSNNVNELRPKRSSRPLRSTKNEVGTDMQLRNSFKLCPVEIPALDDRDITPTNEEVIDPLIAEREARRKEIQSLIMKYSALDEAYNNATSSTAITAISAVTPVVKQAPQPPPHGIKVAHKYQPPLVALTVSRFDGERVWFNLDRLDFLAL